MDEKIIKFNRLILDRSKGNTASIALLLGSRLFGQAVTILRQELDSLIRVCYLMEIEDISERLRLIESTNRGEKWKRNGKIVREAAMIDLARKYNHWAPEVYFFGNCFTHLTDFHDYKATDPLTTLSEDKKRELRYYLKWYHQFPDGKDINFENVIPYLPKVAEKVSHNLKSYLQDLNNTSSINN